jgi:hypothetical protein
MRRLILILNCLAIFYAGAVWAVEGCTDFGVDPDAQHHNESGVPSHHHDTDAIPHHSHSDQSKIHCPNVFGEFLISSRASVHPNNDYVYHATFAASFSHGLIPSVSSQGMGHGPPGSVHSKNLPRHLLLSVIRV